MMKLLLWILNVNEIVWFVCKVFMVIVLLIVKLSVVGLWFYFLIVLCEMLSMWEVILIVLIMLLIVVDCIFDFGVLLLFLLFIVL